MIRKLILPSLAVLGLGLAIYTVHGSNPVRPATAPLAPPAVAPFEQYLSGAGLIEASTENISVGTLVSGVVAEVMVRVNDRVKAGEALFRIDDRTLQAQLGIEQAMLVTAQSELARLRQSPRAEDLPPLEARVAAAQATSANAQREFDRLSRIGDVARTDETERARWDLATAQANLAAASGELARVKAGAWDADLAVAQAAVTAAEARKKSVEVELERLIVRSPVDGTVMQMRIRKGEFASAASSSDPLMLIGDLETLHLRIDIDENDAWRFHPGARAHATVRGNSALKTDMTFVRVEPYIIPKRSLTGESSERVDTRVLQVLYAFDASAFEAENGARVYAGQQMDAFIDIK